MHNNNNSLHIKHTEFENIKTIKEIQKLSDELKITKETLQKININDKSKLLEIINNNLKQLTNAYTRVFDAFFSKHEINSMRDIYIESSKKLANKTIEEINKSTKEISKKLSNFCVDESKHLLNKNYVDIASNYLDTALLLDINNAAAYYYLCLIAFAKNKLVDALINIKKAVKLNFNKKFCMHYIKIIKNKLN